MRFYFILKTMLGLSFVFGVGIVAAMVIGERIGFHSENILLYYVSPSNELGGVVDGLSIYDRRYLIAYPYKTGCKLIGFAWSPDGEAIALSARCPGQPEGVYVMDSDGRNFRWLVEGSPTFGNVQWSPDGSYLFYNDNQVSRIVSVSVNLQTGLQSIYAIHDLKSGKFMLYSNSVVDPSDYPLDTSLPVRPDFTPPVPQGWQLLLQGLRPKSQSERNTGGFEWLKIG